MKKKVEKVTTNKAAEAKVSKKRLSFSFKKILTPFAYILGYFKNSWLELKNVEWPNRKATWSMIFAVLVFSGFFIALIVLLDLGFDELFNLIIK